MGRFDREVKKEKVVKTVSKIRKVGIVGAGNQGPKIAYRCAVSGLQTLIYDISSDAMQKGLNLVHQWFEEAAKAGCLTAQQVDAARVKLRVAASIEELACQADLVIEAVPENLPLKRQVFVELGRLAAKRTLLATNSSSLPSSRLADATNRPDKVFNINFSDPVHDNLVEVMKGATTSDETLLAGVQFVRSLNMVPIVTYKEIMGFSFNRVWRAIKREVLHLVDGGFSDYEDLDRAWMLEFGTPYGPFGLMDMIGLDVVRDIEMQYYFESRDERDCPPKLLDNLIANGRLGVKTGRGFYSYPNPDYKNPDWLRKLGRWSEDITPKQTLQE